MSGSGVYYAQYDVLGDRDLGDHEQVRYVQGDVDQIFIQHGGRWHKVPRGGIVAGARAGMVLRSPLTHRPIDVTLEFGRRLVDGFASRPAYLDEVDTVKYTLLTDDFSIRVPQGQISAPLRCIYLDPPKDEIVLVRIFADKKWAFGPMIVNRSLQPPRFDRTIAIAYGNITAPDLFFAQATDDNPSFRALKNYHDPWPDGWFLTEPNRQYAIVGNVDDNSTEYINVHVRLLGKAEP